MTTDTSRDTTRSRRNRIVIATAVLVAAVVTVVLTLTVGGGDDGNGDAGANQPPPTASGSTPSPQDSGLSALARRTASDPLAVGRADAPVVMIEYSDFQCPFCGRFARETEPELLRSYVNKGVLRIEWRNFPLFGKESERAALAGWAAGQQRKFWEFQAEAYAEPRKRNSGAFSTDRLVAMAKKAGVTDIARFRDDLTSEEARQALHRDQEEGYELGVTSTPAFLINGDPLLGAQPTKSFTEAVEAAAEAAKR